MKHSAMLCTNGGTIKFIVMLVETPCGTVSIMYRRLVGRYCVTKMSPKHP